MTQTVSHGGLTYLSKIPSLAGIKRVQVSGFSRVSHRADLICFAMQVYRVSGFSVQGDACSVRIRIERIPAGAALNISACDVFKEDFRF